MTELALELEPGEELCRIGPAVIHRGRWAGAPVAVKDLPVQDSPAAARASARLESTSRTWRVREAMALARVRHRVIPEVLSVTLGPQCVRVVSAWPAGAPLRELLGSVPLSWGELVTLGVELSRGLAALHAKGLVAGKVTTGTVWVQVDPGRRLRLTAIECHEVVLSGLLAADLHGVGLLLDELSRGVAGSPRPTALDAIVARLIQEAGEGFESASALADELARSSGQSPASPPAHPIDGRAHPAAADRLPFVGRDPQLEALRSAWRRAREERRGGVMLLEGEGGVGKSRIVEELVESLESDVPVLSARASAGASRPHALFCAALEGALAMGGVLGERVRGAVADRAAFLRRASPSLGQRRPGRRGDLEGIGPVGDERDLGETDETGDLPDEPLLAAMAAVVLDLATAARGAVLWLEDLQWADPGSLRFLSALCARLTSAPLLVVGTFRPEAAAAETLDAVVEAIGPALVGRVRVRPLDEGGVRELLTRYFEGARVAQEVVGALVARSEGRPFELGQHLRALLDSAALRPVGGAWELDLEASSLPAPPEPFTREERALLNAAALMGGVFRLSIAARAAGIPASQALRRAVLPQRAGVITFVSAQQGKYRFVHDRQREAIAERLSGEEKARLHAALVEAIEAERDEDPSRIYAMADHAFRGTWVNPPAVYARCLAAGRAALVACAFDDARRFFSQAGLVAERQALRPDAALERALGRADYGLQRLDEARTRFERALALEAQDVERASTRLALSKVCLSLRDVSGASREVVAAFEALRLRPPSGGLGELVTTLLAGLAAMLRSPPGSGSRARARTAELSRARVEALVLAQAGLLAWIQGDRWVLAQAVLRAGPIVAGLGESREYVGWRALSALAAALVGWPWLARRWSARAIAIARQLSDPRASAKAALFDELRALSSGRASRYAPTQELATLSEHAAWLDHAEVSAAREGLARLLGIRAWPFDTR